MRLPRVRVLTMMAAIAFLALALAVVVLPVRFNQALIREERLRAEAEVKRAQRAIAEMQSRQVRPLSRQQQSAASPSP